MKPNLNTILLIIAIILIFFFARGRFSGSSSSSRDTIFSTITLKYDSTQRMILQPVIQNHYKIEVNQADLPKDIDSAAVVKDYFSKYVDQDVRRDSFIEASIQDTIFMNRRIGRLFTYKLLKPVAVTQTAMVEDRSRARLYCGGFAGNSSDKLSAGLSISMIAGKQENQFGIDYDLVNKFPEGFRIRIQKLISFRSKK